MRLRSNNSTSKSPYAIKPMHKLNSSGTGNHSIEIFQYSKSGETGCIPYLVNNLKKKKKPQNNLTTAKRNYGAVTQRDNFDRSKQN